MIFSPLGEDQIDIETGVREDTGCGDSFASAIAAYWMHNPKKFNLQEANRFAHYAAGILYQLPRPHFTGDDLAFIAEAHKKARRANVGNDERKFIPVYASISAFNETEAQEPKNNRARILVLLVDNNVGYPQLPDISGVDLGLGNIFRGETSSQLIKTMRPLLRQLIRITPINNPRLGFEHVKKSDFDRLAKDEANGIHAALLADGGSHHSGVLRNEFEKSPPGITFLRASIAEAKEVVADQRYREIYNIIKLWQFTHTNIDSLLRDYIVKKLITEEEAEKANNRRPRDAYPNAHRHILLKATGTQELAKEATNHIAWLSVNLLQRVYRELLSN
jgi:hypothetical protein